MSEITIRQPHEQYKRKYLYAPQFIDHRFYLFVASLWRSAYRFFGRAFGYWLSPFLWQMSRGFWSMPGVGTAW
jgi:hypothetical protein